MRFYLAGGTALAPRHGHRRSVDFDFFRPDAFDGFAFILSLRHVFSECEQLPSGEHTVQVRLNGVSASFFRLPYPLVQPAEVTAWGVGLASDHDIAAMKLEAIAGRGSRKDFVDLRLLCSHGLAISRVLELFEQKYGTPRSERYHRLRALAFFADAEHQPEPDMLIPFDWEEAKRFFTQEAALLLVQELGR